MRLMIAALALWASSVVAHAGYTQPLFGIDYTITPNAPLCIMGPTVNCKIQLGTADSTGIFSLTGKITSNLTMSGSGTSNYPFNYIFVTDGAFSNPLGNTYGLYVKMTGRNSASNGFRFAMGSLCEWDTPGDTASTAGHNGCVGVLAQGIANYDNSITPAGGLPAMWGLNSNVVATASAKNWGNIQSIEADTTTSAGADYTSRVGLSLLLDGDGPQASTRDMGISFLAPVTTAHGWACLICFDKLSGGQPIDATGTILGVISGPAMTVANGIKFDYGLTFTGKAFASPGWSVDGSGNEIANSLTVPSLTGYTKAHGASQFTAAATVPCSDIANVSLANCSLNTYDIHFKNYGAVGDGVTDDTVAINSAFAAARTTLALDQFNSVRIVCDPGKYLTTTTIDATVLQTYASTKQVTIDGDGCTILGEQNGTPVIDATGNTAIDWGRIKIYGVGPGGGNFPTIGLLFARIPPSSLHINADLSTTALSNCCTNVDRNTLNEVTFQGFFSLAPFYNFASEQNDFYHVKFVNSHTSTSSYAAIWDGINHFGVFSRFITKTYSAWVTSTVYANGAYVTNAGNIYYAPTGGTSGASAPTCLSGTCSDGTITWYWVHAVDGYAHLPPDFSQPLGNNSCYGCILQSNAGGPTIWIAGTGNQKFIGGYALNSNNYPIFIFDGTAGSIGSFHTTLHMEGGASNLAAIFEFQNGGTPLIQGLHYEEVALFIKTSAASVFRLGTGVTAVTIRDLFYRVDIPFTLSTYPIFDTSANYTIQGGDVYTQSSSSWAAPASFSGKLCFSTGCRFVGGSFYETITAAKTADYTLGSEDASVIFNCAASCTLTLPAAPTWKGRIVRVLTYAAFTVVSASSNVVPITGGAAGTAILAATAGKWARLKSDGSNWLIDEAN